MSLKDLQAKRTEILAQSDGIEAYAKSMGRDLNDEESDRLVALASDLEGVDASIANLQKAEAARAKLSAAASAPVGRKAAAVIEVGASERDKLLADPARGFKCSAEFFTKVMEHGAKGKMDARLEVLAAAGSDEHGEYDDSHGGFLVPPQYVGNPLKTGFDADPTSGLTTRVPMSAPTVKIPARVDKNHATSVTGGLRVYRRNETGNVTASRSELEQISLNANSLMGYSFATDELITDSPITIAALIANGFQDEINSKIIDEKINGTGVGQYEGVLNSSALITVAKEGGQAADTVVGLNIVKMRARCWGYGQAVWIVNHDVLPQLVGLHIAGTNGDQAIFQPALTSDVPDMLLGRPVIFHEAASTLGDVGDVILGNWSQYLEGQLGGIDSAQSIHVRFDRNETAFRTSVRNDGKCWWRSALTPKKGATLSPFVTLAARA